MRNIQDVDCCTRNRNIDVHCNTPDTRQQKRGHDGTWKERMYRIWQLPSPFLFFYLQVKKIFYMLWNPSLYYNLPSLEA